MAHEAQRMDVSHLPEVLALAERVKRSNTPRILVSADGEPLARVTPATTKPRRLRGKRTSPNDPIWNIVSMGRSQAGPTDVSAHVDEFLAEWEVSPQRP